MGDRNLDLLIDELANNLLKEASIVEEYSRIIKIIADWLPRDLENNLQASEFIFYKPAYPFISETIWDVLKKIKEEGIEYHAYSSCAKDKDGDPVLFYKLIIPLKRGE